VAVDLEHDRSSIDQARPGADRTQEAPMQYAILIYDEDTADPSAATQDADAWQRTMGEYNAYTKMLQDRGAFKGGEALEPVTTATTVRVRNGETLMTDGPFAETKEGLGGFYLIEAADLDEAIELAAACPGARYGSIEVRPVVTYPAPAG
jgi:hypothetical protein